MAFLPLSKDTQSTDQCLSQAALFRAIALGFAYPVAGHSYYFQQTLSKLAEPPYPARSRVSTALRAAQRAWQKADPFALEVEYTRLFLGNPACSLHETAYGDGRRLGGQSTELADIGGFYTAFGLELTDSNPDLPDHLSTELEFYSLLLLKQAYAQSRGNAKRATTVITKARRSFLNDHLGRWADAFVINLRKQTEYMPFVALGELLEKAILAECALIKVQPKLSEGRIAPDFIQADEFTCPRATEQPEPEMEYVN